MPADFENSIDLIDEHVCMAHVLDHFTGPNNIEKAVLKRYLPLAIPGNKRNPRMLRDLARAKRIP
jgi:hypothetical protein